MNDDELMLEVMQKNESSARFVYKLRMDDIARKMSLRQRSMTYEEFWPDFLSRYFGLNDLPSLIAVIGGKRVAYAGFRPYDLAVGARRVALISIAVDPDSRGTGIGSRFLNALSSFAREQGYDDLFAEIKEENSISIHLFEKAGYTFEKKVTRSFEENGKMQAVVVLLYRLKITPEETRKPVFIIAEAGSNWRLGNYERDLKMSRTLIDAAFEAGCDAIKFQTYRSHTVYAPNAGQSDYLSESGFVEDIKAIFDDLSMPYEMIPLLASYCESVGIEFMSSAFSRQDFEALDPYVKRHKIASYEISHIRLLELAAKTKKPLILSTGASEVSDIEYAISYFLGHGGHDLTLLQCSAQYPAKPCAMNLQTIPWMQSYFKLPVGLSDHSSDPFAAPIAAVALGASVIEKHFTLDRRLPGPDHAFAVEPAELKEMVKMIRMTEEMRGAAQKRIFEEEEELFHFARRRLQALTDIKQGEKFVEDKNVAILRPGKQPSGAHPRFIDSLVGKKATRLIKAGEGVQLGDWA
jgi:N-acetylneuraminate synthase